MNKPEYQYTNITSATTTQVFTGKGTLHAITVNTTAAGSIKLIDDITGTTANIGTLKTSIVENTYNYDVYCAKGLRIVTAAASDVTVAWSQG